VNGEHKTMKVLIIEDEPPAAARLETLLQELRPEATVLAKIDSIRASVAYLSTHTSPDLILMDIQLADGMSFLIFDQCDVTAPVIFITAYDEYAIRAFKKNGIDYILKPVDKDELSMAFKKFESIVRVPDDQRMMMESMVKAVQSITKSFKERFVIKVGDHLRTVAVADILCFFSQDKATFAQTRDGRKHILDFTLDELDTIIDPSRFFRINRKYLVSLQAIQDMISYTNSRLKLVLKGNDDKDIIVARERVQEFKSWLEK